MLLPSSAPREAQPPPELAEPGPMRVALVIERFAAGRGGVESVAWQVAHGLAAAGDEVHVVTRRTAQPPDVARATACGGGALRVHRVRTPAFWQPLRLLAFSRAAARAAPRAAFDVVLSFSRTRHQDLYRAGAGSHADYLAHRYGPWGRALRLLSPRHRVQLAVERRVFADSGQAILCNSRAVRDALVRRYAVDPERLHVIHNGVDLERFTPAQRTIHRARLRRILGADGAPVWLLLGSGWQRKGLDTALAALAAGGARDAWLWVVGRDATAPWRTRARALGVEARVRFLGERRDPEALYAAADALLLPTRYDPFANACLEAAAVGLPVVTSAGNGATEVLGDGAWVVPDAEDVGAFARALAALADPATRAARGDAARRAAARCGWPERVRALRALHARIAARKRTTRSLAASARPGLERG